MVTKRTAIGRYFWEIYLAVYSLVHIVWSLHTRQKVRETREGISQDSCTRRYNIQEPYRYPLMLKVLVHSILHFNKAL